MRQRTSHLHRAIVVAILAGIGYAYYTNVQARYELPDPMGLALLGAGLVALLLTAIVSLTPVRRGRTRTTTVLDADGRPMDAGASRDGPRWSPPWELVSPFTPGSRGRVSRFSPSALGRELTHEKTVLTVVSYVLIAEFGVFSSRTLPAPDLEVGLAFGLTFLGLSLVYIRHTYASYLRGLSHLVLALVFGVAASVVLGHYWGATPLTTLLSLRYFETEALVAVVTGIAVALIMGSKG